MAHQGVAAGTVPVTFSTFYASGLASAAKELRYRNTNLQAKIVSRPTVMGGYQAVTIDAMTNHKGTKAMTLCCSAAAVVLAAGCGGASAESPSSTTTSLTITTTKSPFSNLTQEPAPPATSGGQTGGAVSVRRS